METLGQVKGTGSLGRKDSGWWEMVSKRWMRIKFGLFQSLFWNCICWESFSLQINKLNTNWLRQSTNYWLMQMKSPGAGLADFRCGLFHRFLTPSRLLLSFSAILSTWHALLCSVLCAGLGLSLAPVMVAAMASVVQDLPFICCPPARGLLEARGGYFQRGDWGQPCHDWGWGRPAP